MHRFAVCCAVSDVNVIVAKLHKTGERREQRFDINKDIEPIDHVQVLLVRTV